MDCANRTHIFGHAYTRCRVTSILVWVISACSSSTPPTATVGPPASVVATSASGDDVIVARVNGRPVWGSCIAAQAVGASLGREAALQQCIDFELLAQTAEQRGHATHGDVIVQTKTAMVNELIQTAYEAGFTKPAQFGPAWDKILAKTKLPLRWKHGEYRASSYVRVQLDPKATKQQDDEARAVIEKVAAAVAEERGLLGPHLVALAQPIAGAVKLFHQDVPLYKHSGLDPAYADALFAISEIGRASGAVRTRDGWDVIIWTGLEPETSPSSDELIAKLLPDVKQLYFNTWVASVAQRLGIRVQFVEGNIAKLETLP